ncbi:MAG: TonB-dependent receptor [Bacteroidota bacterium]
MLIFFLTIHLVRAQEKFVFQGKLEDFKGKPAVEVPVQLLELKKLTLTDENGIFTFELKTEGTYTLFVQTLNYETYSEKIAVKAGQTSPRIISVKEKIVELDQVVVEGEEEVLGIKSLKGIQDGVLYEAKKNEIINISQLVGNKAANNARQAYARVPSLNIWESDDAGIQLDIGGRGLSPRRSTNFNVRQNGYDISADALGYPESYYSPSLQAVDEIEIVRGAGALQYGTQFGGLVNFKLKEGNREKPFEFNTQNTYGAFNFFSTFNSIGGQVGKLNYYSYYNYKRGDGWRQNTGFDFHNAFLGLEYELNPKFNIRLEYTRSSYLSEQPGGLNISQFEENPRFSNRDRGYFRVRWNLAAVLLEYEITQKLKLYSRTFGLDARRTSLGSLETPNIDLEEPNRDLQDGDFLNIGNETRVTFDFNGFNGQKSEVLLGTRIYRGTTTFIQAIGSEGSDANFNAIDTLIAGRTTSNFDFPNLNFALFGETIFRLSESLSIVPGFRYEYISTEANGISNRAVQRTLFDVELESEESNIENRRQVFLWGLGVSKKFNNSFEIYLNATANYRAINFTDVQIEAPAQLVDSDIKDEQGQSFDIGFRKLKDGSPFHYEANVFLIRYNDRIGETQVRLNRDREILGDDEIGILGRFRTNIGDATIAGFELFGEVDLADILSPGSDYKVSVFYNGSLNFGRYQRINEAVGAVVSSGNRIEELPTLNIKSGLSYGYKKFSSSLQATYVSEQFSDAANQDPSIDIIGVVGTIPAYFVLDFSVNYKVNKFIEIHSSLNNLLDEAYFTRRATGYPGPGIIPALGRTWNITLDMTF